MLKLILFLMLFKIQFFRKSDLAEGHLLFGLIFKILNCSGKTFKYLFMWLLNLRVTNH